MLWSVVWTRLPLAPAIDTNGDSLPELAVGHTDGTLDVLDMSSASILHHYTGCASGLIAAIAADKLSSASPGDVLFSCGSHVGWMSLTSGATEVITSVIGNQVGVGDNLMSFGSALSSDRIIVGSYTGVTHLAPVSALAPFVDPGNARTPMCLQVIGQSRSPTRSHSARSMAPQPRSNWCRNLRMAR
jgi:hypothetical protein